MQQMKVMKYQTALFNSKKQQIQYCCFEKVFVTCEGLQMICQKTGTEIIPNTVRTSKLEELGSEINVTMTR